MQNLSLNIQPGFFGVCSLRIDRYKCCLSETISPRIACWNKKNDVWMATSSEKSNLEGFHIVKTSSRTPINVHQLRWEKFYSERFFLYFGIMRIVQKFQNHTFSTKNQTYSSCSSKKCTIRITSSLFTDKWLNELNVWFLY